MKHTYEITGHPVAHIKRLETSIWNDYRKDYVIHRINIENQHGDKPRLMGRLHIDIHFTFDEKTTPRQRDSLTKKHAGQNTIIAYVRHIEEVAREVLFDPMNVVSLQASMGYGEVPKTVFSITNK